MVTVAKVAVNHCFAQEIHSVYKEQIKELRERKRQNREIAERNGLSIVPQYLSGFLSRNLFLAYKDYLGQQ